MTAIRKSNEDSFLKTFLFLLVTFSLHMQNQSKKSAKSPIFIRNWIDLTSKYEKK